MLKRLRKIWRAISETDTAISIWQLVGGSLVSGITLLFSYVQKAPMALTLVLALLAFAITIFIINQLAMQRDRIRFVSTSGYVGAGAVPKNNASLDTSPVNPLDSYFSRKVIRFQDLLAGGESLLRDKVFEDCIIIGPAILLPLSNNTISDCNFDGDMENMFIIVAKDQRIMGVVAIEGCTFRRCRFKTVGFIGNSEMVEEFKRGFRS